MLEIKLEKIAPSVIMAWSWLGSPELKAFREIRSENPEELLHNGDLTLISNGKLEAWKGALES